MPPVSQERDGEGRWNPVVFFLLFWQFVAAAILLYLVMIAFAFKKCFTKTNTCVTLTLSDSIWFAVMFLNLGLLVVNCYEMFVWTQESLFINAFLCYELVKGTCVFMLATVWTIPMFRYGHKTWATVWTWGLVLVFFAGPFFAELMIVGITKWRSGKVLREEERSLLIAAEEPPPTTTSTLHSE